VQIELTQDLRRSPELERLAAALATELPTLAASNGPSADRLQ